MSNAQLDVQLNPQEPQDHHPSSSSSSSSSSLSSSPTSFSSSSLSSVSNKLGLLYRSNSLQSNSSNIHTTASSTCSSRTSSTSKRLFPPTPPHSYSNSPFSQRIQPHKNISPPTPPSSRTTSRNDIFSLSFPQPSSLLSSIPKPLTENGTTTHPIQPSYDQRDLTRLKTSLRVRIDLSRTAVLGQGTHGIVHLASFRPDQPRQEAQLGAIKTRSPSPHQSNNWNPCAAKVSYDIPGSVKEALVLERLRPKETDQAHCTTHPSNLIVGWSGLKEQDECEWIRTADEASKQRQQTPSQSVIPSIILVLEFCPGGDLLKFVQRAIGSRSEEHSEDNQFYVDRRRWMTWSREIAAALAWCKKCNVLVGDLKPQNILLTSQLGIRLSDFNCSTIMSTDESQYGTSLIDPQGTGTSVYAAPELVRPPPSPCSYPADIFALGVTLYFLITGREPYRGVQSAVERMLLISRGAFWQHELAIRWRALEDGQSVPRSSSKFKQTNPVKFVPWTSAEPIDCQTYRPIASSNRTQQSLEYTRDIESKDCNTTTSEIETVSHQDDDTNQSQFYHDLSPKICHLNGNEFVDERIMKLISQMCSPLASDRPQIEQVIQELTLL